MKVIDTESAIFFFFWGGGGESVESLKWDVAISWQLRGLCGCYEVCVATFP